MTRHIRKLAIVGASARAAAFSAIRAGYDVVAADLFADADLARVAPVTRIIGYPTALADWLAATECDAWMYTGALENYPDLVDRMAAVRPLLGNSGAALRDVRDPLKLQSACRDAGIAFPETRTSADALPLDGSWLCKTYRGSSGSGVWRLDGVAALEKARREQAVFQVHVRGMPAAAIYAVTRDRGVLLGLTRQLMHPRDEGSWKYAGSLGPLQASESAMHQLECMGTWLAQRWSLSGVVGVDLVIDDASAWLIEINPRYSASAEIVERFACFPMVATHVVACRDGESIARHIGGATTLLAPGSMTYGKSVLYARRDVRISTEVHEWMIQRTSFDPQLCTLADIPHADEAIAQGQPVLTAFAAGTSEGDCRRRLETRLAEIESQVYDEPL